MRIYKGKVLPGISWKMMLFVLAENIGAETSDSYGDGNGSFSYNTTTVPISANATENGNPPDVECYIYLNSTGLYETQVYRASETVNVSCMCDQRSTSTLHPANVLCPAITALDLGSVLPLVRRLRSERSISNGSCLVAESYLVEPDVRGGVEFVCSEPSGSAKRVSTVIDIVEIPDYAAPLIADKAYASVAPSKVDKAGAKELWIIYASVFAAFMIAIIVFYCVIVKKRIRSRAATYCETIISQSIQKEQPPSYTQPMPKIQESEAPPPSYSQTVLTAAILGVQKLSSQSTTNMAQGGGRKQTLVSPELPT